MAFYNPSAVPPSAASASAVSASAVSAYAVPAFALSDYYDSLVGYTFDEYASTRSAFARSNYGLLEPSNSHLPVIDMDFNLYFYNNDLFGLDDRMSFKDIIDDKVYGSLREYMHFNGVPSLHNGMYSKFFAHQNILESLLKTGNKILYLVSPKNLDEGIGFIKYDEIDLDGIHGLEIRNRIDDYNMVGENYYGQLLMRVRSKLSDPKYLRRYLESNH
jgi:hypothetical protein